MRVLRGLTSVEVPWPQVELAQGLRLGLVLLLELLDELLLLQDPSLQRPQLEPQTRRLLLTLG